eukprot:12250219-Prorocentrum_lima.AAC.1
MSAFVNAASVFSADIAQPDASQVRRPSSSTWSDHVIGTNLASVAESVALWTRLAPAAPSAGEQSPDGSPAADLTGDE